MDNTYGRLHYMMISPKLLALQNRLTSSDNRVHNHLIMNAETQGKMRNKVSTTVSKIADALGINEKSVRRAISKLKEEGAVEVTRTGGNSFYKLTGGYVSISTTTFFESESVADSVELPELDNAQEAPQRFTTDTDTGEVIDLDNADQCAEYLLEACPENYGQKFTH